MAAWFLGQRRARDNLRRDHTLSTVRLNVAVAVALLMSVTVTV